MVTEIMVRLFGTRDERRRFWKNRFSEIRERDEQVLRQIEASAEPVLPQIPQLRQYFEYCIGFWRWRSDHVNRFGYYVPWFSHTVIDDTLFGDTEFSDKMLEVHQCGKLSQAEADQIVSGLQTALEHEGSSPREKIRAVAGFCVDTVSFLEDGLGRHHPLVRNLPSPDVRELCKPYLG